MNPNYLLKEEIDYELRVTGLDVSGDVNLLQKLFRSVTTEAVIPNLEKLRDFDPQEHMDYITSKTQEVELLLEKATTKLSAIGLRVRTRIRHCVGRLTTPLNWTMLPENISVPVIRDLIICLETIEQRAIQCASSWSEDGAVAEGMMQHYSGAAHVPVQADIMEQMVQVEGPGVATCTRETREANSVTLEMF